MDIKQENVLSDDVDSQNEREFFITMRRNSDDVTIKTEIKSETSFIKHSIEQIKCETITCSNNWEIDKKTEIKKQTLVSEFDSQNEGEFLTENPVMKDNSVDHEIEIKEEPWWLETETSTVCEDIKVTDFPPLKPPRFYMETVSGDSGAKSPEESGRDRNSYYGKDHLKCERQKSDVTELTTAEEHVLSEQFGRCSDKREMYVRPLDWKQESLIHKAKSPHQCNTCNKSFAYLSRLKTHNLIHEGKKPHQCKTCNKSFTRLSNLKTHILVHEGKKPHQCKTCDMSFTQLSYLKTHILVHQGKKPYQCKTCDKRFTQLSTLRTHNWIHEGKKPHECKICHKSFTKLSHLKIHKLIHEGEKPHQCKTCDKRFTQMSHLKTHTLIHEGKKQHKCETCDKSFTVMSDLRRHTLIHEGKKPHQCKTCDKSFTKMSDLRRHMLIHEGKR